MNAYDKLKIEHDNYYHFNFLNDEYKEYADKLAKEAVSTHKMPYCVALNNVLTSSSFRRLISEEREKRTREAISAWKNFK